MPAWKGSGEEARNGETRRHDPHVQPLPFLLPFRTFCCSCCRDLSTSCFRPRLTALVFVLHGRAKVRSGFPPLRLSPPRRAFPRFPTLIRNSFVAIPFRRDSIFFLSLSFFSIFQRIGNARLAKGVFFRISRFGVEVRVSSSFFFFFFFKQREF